MKYAIYQIKATFGDTEAQNAKMAMMMDFAGTKIGGLAWDALDQGLYTHVANIEATDPNKAFDIGNIGPEESIERIGRMSSLSVGDILVDEEGLCIVIASEGFVAFSFNPKLAA